MKAWFSTDSRNVHVFVVGLTSTFRNSRNIRCIVVGPTSTDSCSVRSIIFIPTSTSTDTPNVTATIVNPASTNSYNVTSIAVISTSTDSYTVIVTVVGPSSTSEKPTLNVIFISPHATRISSITYKTTPTMANSISILLTSTTSSKVFTTDRRIRQIGAVVGDLLVISSTMMLKCVAGHGVRSISIRVSVNVLAVSLGLQGHQYPSSNRLHREIFTKVIATVLTLCTSIAVSRVFYLVRSVEVLEKVVFIVLKRTLGGFDAGEATSSPETSIVSVTACPPEPQPLQFSGQCRTIIPLEPPLSLCLEIRE